MNHKSVLISFGIFLIGLLALSNSAFAQTSLRYTQDIYFGLKNLQVGQLQQDLAKDTTVYPEGLVTGYFGPLTLRAVKNFQAKYGIRQTGYVGHITRGKLNVIFSSASNTECKTDSDCPSQYMCQETQGSGTACPSTDPTCVPTHTFIKGVCQLKQNPGAYCLGDSDCANGLLCHAGVCTNPVANACSGPEDTSCGYGYQCIADCGPPVVYPGYVRTGPWGHCTLNKQASKPRMCPICLSAKTLIDTPSGSVLVKDLRVGMQIWTTDKSGHRVSGVVQKTSRVPVPPTHQMVHFVLDDGRSLFVSPGHPTIDGRTVGNLSINDLYDGSHIITSERVAYGDVATYDILPSGETGFYWANGILLDSTLH